MPTKPLSEIPQNCELMEFSCISDTCYSDFLSSYSIFIGIYLIQELEPLVHLV